MKALEEDQEIQIPSNRMREIFVKNEKLDQVVKHQMGVPTDYFFDENDLQEYRVSLDKQNLYIDCDGSDCDGLYLYVVSETGAEYFIPHEESMKNQLHHSYPLCGKDSPAAGVIRLKDGKEIWRDNNSGHYAISTKNIIEGLANIYKKYKKNEKHLKTILFYDYTNHPINKEVHVYLVNELIESKGELEELTAIRKATYAVSDTNSQGKSSWRLVSGSREDVYFPFSDDDSFDDQDPYDDGELRLKINKISSEESISEESQSSLGYEDELIITSLGYEDEIKINQVLPEKIISEDRQYPLAMRFGKVKSNKGLYHFSDRDDSSIKKIKESYVSSLQKKFPLRRVNSEFLEEHYIEKKAMQISDKVNFSSAHANDEVLRNLMNSDIQDKGILINVTFYLFYVKIGLKINVDEDSIKSNVGYNQKKFLFWKEVIEGAKAKIKAENTVEQNEQQPEINGAEKKQDYY